ncbi:PAS domain S-box protein [Noviherbaspirillum galbum]|uniref:histidine kinase n=1 Tax=Noviherbaspirillum galbum TaxID=2709383 RepID=A0A6B3SMS3_9BURK|nr:PAS domain S-box protein [Noviherbaspirillum galbum]NEX62154.1 PAS domain S-box protein [Noviherbaspirillum galbum]
MEISNERNSGRPNLAAIKDVLALSVRGAPFGELADSLLQACRRLIGEDSRTSLYVVDPAQQFLRLAASAGLAPAFMAAVQRLAIGEGEASCGRAASLREVVLVEDVLAEPRLAPYRDLARAHDIRSCWSFPLNAPDGRIVGTLAFYHAATSLPGKEVEEEIRYFADLAAIVIDRHLRGDEEQRRDEAARQELLAVAAESERRKRLYETILAATPDLVYVFDLNHRFTYANRVLLQMWGRTWDEAIGKNCLELGYEPWHAEMHDREIEQVKATKRPIRGEVPFNGTFGRRIYDYIFVPVFGPDGEVEAVAGTTRDVTERKQFEEELRMSEQRALEAARRAEQEKRHLDALLEAVPVGIGYADNNGRLFRINAENRRLWGGMPEAEGVSDYQRWTARWVDGLDRHGKLLQPEEWGLARALKGEDVRGDLIEIERFDKARTRRTVLLRATPVRDTDGSILGAVVAQMDMTDQLRVEAALRESERKFRTITNAMPQMVWTASPDGMVDYHNERFYDFTGETAAAPDANIWARRLHPEDHDAAQTLWQHCVATGEWYETTYRLRHHSGEYRWILARGVPILDDAGTILKWMGTDTDIHESKQAEEALQASHRRKDEFLAMLAHELRNPLAPISAAADILRAAPSDPVRVRQYSDMIARQVDHMTALVNDLLDVSRVTRGLVDLERDEVDLKNVVASAVEQVRPLIEARGHALTLRIGAAHAGVHGDRTRLIQVISNLLSNAAKYTPQGGQISLSMDVDGGRVDIAVEDNGTGIADDLLPHVFELFVQGKRTPDRAQGGLGLGLALVKSIVEMHGGKAEARSRGIDQGSTFLVSLPVVPLNLSIPLDSGRMRVHRTDHPLRVLLVDDNQDAALAMAGLLESAGHAITVANDPQQALALAAAREFNCFVLDIGLPGMTGYELAQQLRANARFADAVFIAVTGYGQSHDKAQSMAAGFAHHLIKPVGLRQLTEAMGRPALDAV